MPYKIALAQALLVDGGIELIPWVVDENGDEMELDTFENKLRFLRKRGLEVNSESNSPPSLQTVRSLYRKERQLKKAEDAKMLFANAKDDKILMSRNCTIFVPKRIVPELDVALPEIDHRPPTELRWNICGYEDGVVYGDWHLTFSKIFKLQEI